MLFRLKLISAMLALMMAFVAVNTCALASGDQPVTQAQLLGLLVSTYEFIAGDEIDDSKITSKLSTDKPVRKALELDLLEDYEVAWAHLPATRQTAAARILALKNALRTRLYGTATHQATVAQARDELALAFALTHCTDSVSAALALTQDMNDDDLLTRARLCELAVRAYEALVGPVELNGSVAPADTSDEYVLKAIQLGIMDIYEVSNTFEPDAPVQLRQIAPTAIRLVGLFDYAMETMTRAQARDAVGELLLSCVGVPLAEGETTLKLNDVNWDWYVNQLTTGKYSANNCMPACGEMVLNYLNRENVVTTATLRALSPHDGEGWYDVEFYDVMTDQGVKLESEYEMTVDNMVRDVDAGHLLVVMCNFDGAASGHAMVVCGYERTPAGTWFICNDPESSTTNKYGKPAGYMRHVESQELVQAMNRHVDRYFRVMN